MSELFGGSAPPTPAIKPPAPIPDQDAILAQKRLAMAAQSANSGRASTILSQDSTGVKLGS